MCNVCYTHKCVVTNAKSEWAKILYSSFLGGSTYWCHSKMMLESQNSPLSLCDSTLLWSHTCNVWIKEKEITWPIYTSTSLVVCLLIAVIMKFHFIALHCTYFKMIFCLFAAYEKEYTYFKQALELEHRKYTGIRKTSIYHLYKLGILGIDYSSACPYENFATLGILYAQLGVCLDLCNTHTLSVVCAIFRIGIQQH